MDLNHLELPASLVAELYTGSLVDTGEPTATVKTIEPVLPDTTTTVKPAWRSLGENKKKILVVVNSDAAVHLPDQELQLLSSMLMACQLSLADVAIVNIHQQKAMYKDLVETFNSRIALLFAVEPAAFGLPMSFPFFQIQAFAGCSFLYAPSLQELEHDKMQKSKLWLALRRLFNL